MRCDEFEVSQRRAESSSGTFAHTRLLKNGAAAHEFTRDDRAKGGRVRAEKIKKRKELQERFDVATLEALDRAELELAERAIIRLGLLLASEDDRIAMRACKEVFDRVLGRPANQREDGGWIERHSGMETDVTSVRKKLETLIERQARAMAASRELNGSLADQVALTQDDSGERSQVADCRAANPMPERP